MGQEDNRGLKTKRIDDLLAEIRNTTAPRVDYDRAAELFT